MRVLVMILVWLTAVNIAVAEAQNAQQQRRDKIKQKVRALRAYTLTEQLELDEATAAKLFPALAKFDDEFDKLLHARADLQRRLNDAGSLKDAKAVDKLIDEAVANQRAIWDTEVKRLEQLRKILTPAQVARTLVVLPAMERKIQNQLRRVVQKKKARAGGGGQGGDLVEDPFDGDFDKEADDEDLLPPGRKAAKRPAAPAQPAAKKKPCDPFTSVHGCRE